MSIIVILRNVFIIIAYLLMFVAKYCKRKNTMMIVTSLSNVFSGLSHLMFGAYTAATNAIITIIRGFVINYKDKNNKKMTLAYVLFVCCILLNLVITYKGLYCVLVPLSSLLFTTSYWFIRKEQTIRICAFIASIASVLYMFIVKNYVGASLEIFVMLGCVTSWLKYHERKIG